MFLSFFAMMEQDWPPSHWIQPEPFRSGDGKERILQHCPGTMDVFVLF